jgi:hypothetical protein
MSILIEGYVPNSNISPKEADVVGGNGPDVNFQGNLPSCLADENAGGVASLQFDGTEEDGIKGSMQLGLNGVIEPGSSYRVWIKARETGNGETWDAHALTCLLVNSSGAVSGSSGFLWGVDTGRHISGTLQFFTVTINVNTFENEFTPNSIGIYVFAFNVQGGAMAATKALELKYVLVEPIVEM